jgi:predicted phosphoribosyltransferase
LSTKISGPAGSECAVAAYVDGLDGAERKVLMNHIARAWPELVEAGVELVAQWRAESLERRRKALRRREHDRRRRRRAELGDG